MACLLKAVSRLVRPPEGGSLTDAGLRRFVHPVVRRTLVALAVTYALAWAGAAMAVGPGSAALVGLTGNLAHAGLFVALFSVSSATGALILGRLMDRMGRRPILMVAHTCSILGYTLAGTGATLHSILVFVAGGFFLAFGFGGILLTRVAAAEIFPAAQRGRGVGWVQVSATAGAVFGPLLVILSDPVGRITAWDPMVFVWFMGPPIHLVAVFLVSRITEPLEIARDLQAYHPIRDGEPLEPSPSSSPVVPGVLLPVAIVALAANQAAMAAVMGVAGAAVHLAGHAVWVLGVVMFLHFVGMFGLSPLVGRVSDRLGRRNTVLMGIAVLGSGGIVIALVEGLVGFAIGLFLVGVGWSFGFIGTTVLITDIVAADRRARIVGRADLSAQLSAATLALLAGWWFAVHGVMGLGLMAAAIMVVPGSLLLLYVREHRPGVYRKPLAPKSSPNLRLEQRK